MILIKWQGKNYYKTKIDMLSLSILLLGLQIDLAKFYNDWEKNVEILAIAKFFLVVN